jgi:hypothetical protein
VVVGVGDGAVDVEAEGTDAGKVQGHRRQAEKSCPQHRRSARLRGRSAMVEQCAGLRCVSHSA